MPASSSFTQFDGFTITFSWPARYWKGMRLSFKPNVTCRPTRNLRFLNVFSTFRRRNSVVKNFQLVGGLLVADTTDTVVIPALTAVIINKVILFFWYGQTDLHTHGHAPLQQHLPAYGWCMNKVNSRINHCAGCTMVWGPRRQGAPD